MNLAHIYTIQSQTQKSELLSLIAIQDEMNKLDTIRQQQIFMIK